MVAFHCNRNMLFVTFDVYLIEVLAHAISFVSCLHVFHISHTIISAVSSSRLSDELGFMF